MESKLFNLTTPLKIIVSITIITWCIIALFPLLWIVVMSIKLPVDSFASNPLKVIIGPSTKEQVGGLSFVNFIFLFLSIYLFYKLYQIRKILFDLINQKGIEPAYVAGHSLGEYSALYAADIFNFETGLNLVKDRSLAMKKTGENNLGSMAAIIGLNNEKIIEVCNSVSSLSLIHI